jgi:hypothetical protein
MIIVIGRMLRLFYTTERGQATGERFAPGIGT